MDALLDLYGFASVVLHAMQLVARTALLGAVVFWALLLPGLLPALPPGAAEHLQGAARRQLLWAGLASLAVSLLSVGLGSLALAATLELPLGGVAGADFIRAALLGLLAMAAMLALAWPAGPLSGGRRAGLLLAALALLAAATSASHAVAREDGRAGLLAATALHQAGAALWLGGLPCLLAALKLPQPGAARLVGRRYSWFAAAGVGLILLGSAGFLWGYIGEAAGLYGTAYGAMTGTKMLLLALLLGLGLGNWLLLHRLGAMPDGLLRVRRLVECEIAAGIAVLAVAASLTSVPPAADLPEDRVTWAEITERFTPKPPRLASPDHADLAIPALQAQLDAEWRDRQAAQSSRPQAFTPGEGLLPPRNAGDIAWSEYNHHWSGLVVLLVGLAALLDASGRVPLARHWPLLFLGLFVFLFVRSDPESWPLGQIGLLDSLRDPEVVQHKLAAFLVLGFSVSEWGVRLGWLRGRVRFVFPVAMLAGGVLLLSHTHAIANIKEALLVELSHLPLAVLAVAAGCARWTELRGPETLARPARWIWPACLMLIGLLLLIYREA